MRKYSQATTDKDVRIDARRETDSRQGVDKIADTLADDRLGERIAHAARLAMVKHMWQTAQEMRSTVEPESSAQ